jgi:hypothetical protein
MIIKPPETISFIIIDPSLRSTGVLVCREGKIKTYAIQKESKPYDVLAYYVWHFSNLAKERHWDFITIEGYDPIAKGTQAYIQHEVGGCIRAAFAAYKIPIIVMPISTWKAICSFRMSKKTQQNKREYRNAVLERFGYEIDTDDECDCLIMMIAIAYITRGIKKTDKSDLIKEQFHQLKIEF